MDRPVSGAGGPGRRRIAIIGAGGAGTCAALELAGRGHDVDLFERCEEAVSQASFVNEGSAKLLRARRPRGWPRRLEKRLRGLRDDAAARVLVAAGLHPNTLQMMRKWGWRRGGLIRARKRLTG